MGNNEQTADNDKKLAWLINDISHLLAGEDAAPPDKDGVYTLTFDEKLIVECWLDCDYVYFYSPIVGIPRHEQQATELLRRVLLSNVAQMRNAQEVLCINPETNELALFWRGIIETINQEGFRKCLESFLNSLDGWTVLCHASNGNYTADN